MQAVAEPRRCEWEVIHLGCVYTASAEQGALCTYAQAVEAVERSVKYKGDRMQVSSGVVVRVQWVSGDKASDCSPSGRVPFDTRAALEQAKAKHAAAALDEQIIIKAADYTLYHQLRACILDPRLRAIVDQAEAEHNKLVDAHAATDMALARIATAARVILDTLGDL